MYWFITLFENFLFSLKKWFIKSFSRKNIFNSCIENICIIYNQYRSICRLSSFITRWSLSFNASIHYQWFLAEFSSTLQQWLPSKNRDWLSFSHGIFFAPGVKTWRLQNLDPSSPDPKMYWIQIWTIWWPMTGLQ